MKLLLIICGIFYSVLCIFSIVTGIIYMVGKRKLNPLELSDSFVKKIKDIDFFTKKMGFVTLVVGIVQGITAFAIIYSTFHFNFNLFLFTIALGFTIFSICSVSYKLLNKISMFAISKFVCYFIILIVLIVSFVFK